MKRFLLLALLLMGCWRIPTDVSFTTDPRILRGTWTGTLEKQCESQSSGEYLNADATRVFYQTDKGHEFFSITGTKLGTLKPDNRVSPFAWASNNTDVVYIRNAPSTGFQRVTVNPATGAELSAVTLNNEFAGTDSIFSADLTRSAFVSTSAVTGIKRLYWRDLTTGNLLKSVVWNESSSPVAAKFNPSGTKLVYTLYGTSSFKTEVFDFDTETKTQVFASSAVSGTPTFVSDDQLYTTGTTNQGSRFTTSVVGFNLTTQQSNTFVIAQGDYTKNDRQNVLGAVFIGSQVGYVKADVFYVQNLETQAIVAQQPLNTDAPLLYGAYMSGGVQEGTTVGKWLVTAKQPFCGSRVFDLATQTFTSNIDLEPTESQAVQVEFTPTYRDSSSYTLTGKLRIGTQPERSINGVVKVPSSCSLFSSYCEQLNRLSPPPPYFSVYQDSHSVQLEYENGTPTPFDVILVGRRFDTQKAQLFALDYQYTNTSSKTYVLSVNPPATP